jgi:hypothetical protein
MPVKKIADIFLKMSFGSISDGSTILCPDASIMPICLHHAYISARRGSIMPSQCYDHSEA